MSQKRRRVPLTLSRPSRAIWLDQYMTWLKMYDCNASEAMALYQIVYKVGCQVDPEPCRPDSYMEALACLVSALNWFDDQTMYYQEYVDTANRLACAYLMLEICLSRRSGPEVPCLPECIRGLWKRLKNRTSGILDLSDARAVFGSSSYEKTEDGRLMIFWEGKNVGVDCQALFLRKTYNLKELTVKEDQTWNREDLILVSCTWKALESGDLDLDPPVTLDGSAKTMLEGCSVLLVRIKGRPEDPQKGPKILSQLAMCLKDHMMPGTVLGFLSFEDPLGLARPISYPCLGRGFQNKDSSDKRSLMKTLLAMGSTLVPSKLRPLNQCMKNLEEDLVRHVSEALASEKETWTLPKTEVPPEIPGPGWYSPEDHPFGKTKSLWNNGAMRAWFLADQKQDFEKNPRFDLVSLYQVIRVIRVFPRGLFWNRNFLDKVLDGEFSPKGPVSFALRDLTFGSHEKMKEVLLDKPFWVQVRKQLAHLSLNKWFHEEECSLEELALREVCLVSNSLDKTRIEARIRAKRKEP